MAKKAIFYRQCRYEMATEGGKIWDTAWIPENLAKIGKQIYLTAHPEKVYTVVSVGSRRDGAFLKNKENINRKFGQSAGLNCD